MAQGLQPKFGPWILHKAVSSATQQDPVLNLRTLKKKGELGMWVSGGALPTT